MFKAIKKFLSPKEAVLNEAQGDFNYFFKNYENALSCHQKSLTYHFKKKNYHKLPAIYQKIIADKEKIKNSDPHKDYFMLGCAWLKNKDYEAAAQNFGKAMMVGKDNYSNHAQFLQIICHYHISGYYAAKEKWDKLDISIKNLKTSHNDYDRLSNLLLAFINLKFGDPGQSFKYYSKYKPIPNGQEKTFDHEAILLEQCIAPFVRKLNSSEFYSQLGLAFALDDQYDNAKESLTHQVVKPFVKTIFTNIINKKKITFKFDDLTSKHPSQTEKINKLLLVGDAPNENNFLDKCLILFKEEIKSCSTTLDGIDKKVKDLNEQINEKAWKEGAINSGLVTANLAIIIITILMVANIPQLLLYIMGGILITLPILAAICPFQYYLIKNCRNICRRCEDSKYSETALALTSPLSYLFKKASKDAQAGKIIEAINTRKKQITKITEHINSQDNTKEHFDQLSAIIKNQHLEFKPQNLLSLEQNQLNKKFGWNIFFGSLMLAFVAGITLICFLAFPLVMPAFIATAGFTKFGFDSAAFLGGVGAAGILAWYVSRIDRKISLSVEKLNTLNAESQEIERDLQNAIYTYRTLLELNISDNKKGESSEKIKTIIKNHLIVQRSLDELKSSRLEHAAKNKSQKFSMLTILITLFAVITLFTTPFLAPAATLPFLIAAIAAAIISGIAMFSIVFCKSYLDYKNLYRENLVQKSLNTALHPELFSNVTLGKQLDNNVRNSSTLTLLDKTVMFLSSFINGLILGGGAGAVVISVCGLVSILLAALAITLPAWLPLAIFAAGLAAGLMFGIAFGYCTYKENIQTTTQSIEDFNKNIRIINRIKKTNENRHNEVRKIFKTSEQKSTNVQQTAKIKPCEKKITSKKSSNFFAKIVAKKPQIESTPKNIDELKKAFPTSFSPIAS